MNNSKHLIPKLTPMVMKSYPDQTCAILNAVIEAVNELTQDR